MFWRRWRAACRLRPMAIEGPQLPSSAKKLTGKEIVELQNGVTLTYTDFSVRRRLNTGTAVHDFKNNRNSGTYEYKGMQRVLRGQGLDQGRHVLP